MGRPGCPSPDPVDGLEAAIALDRKVTGTDRDRLLRRLAREHPGSLPSSRRARGRWIPDARPGRRPGRSALHRRRSGRAAAPGRRRSRYAGEPSCSTSRPPTHPRESWFAWGASGGAALLRMGAAPGSRKTGAGSQPVGEPGGTVRADEERLEETVADANPSGPSYSKRESRSVTPNIADRFAASSAGSLRCCTFNRSPWYMPCRQSARARSRCRRPGEAG